MIRRQERAPDVVGLVIPRHARLAAEHRRKQAIRGQLPLVGQQRPGEGNRLALEVVAKREVAEHLEEGVMPERRPDVLEVVVLAADAHALLRGRRTRVVARLPAEEDVLELVHPGVGEEQRRIVVRHQRRAGDDAMAVPFEIPEKGRADVRRGHVDLYSVTCRRRGSARTRIGFEALTDQKSIQPLELAFVGDRVAAAEALLQRGGQRARRRRWPRRFPGWRAVPRPQAQCLPLRAGAGPAAVPRFLRLVSACAIARAARSSSRLRSRRQPRDRPRRSTRRRSRGGRVAGAPAARTARAGPAS